jgi:N-methylhydantoinase B
MSARRATRSSKRAVSSARGRAAPFDGVALSLAHGLFAACAEEMGTALMASAHSTNITERLDFSCAIFDHRARLVAQAAHIPVHLGSMPAAADAALALGKLSRGDTVILNDPFAGGTHLPDVTLVSPVFIGSGSKPDFLVASRAHHADVGGAAAGSMPLAREIYAEGLRIPPVWLVREDRTDENLLRLVLANVRTPHERRADLAAQLGAQRIGAQRLGELARRRSPAELKRAAAALIRHGERAMRGAIARLPRGSWAFEDALDDDGLSREPVRIAARLTISRGALTVDFTGSSAQVSGPVNAVLPVTKAAVAYAVRIALGRDVPINHGSLNVLRVIAPPGSVVNAQLPAAVAAGNVETSQRIVDVVLGALARALPAVIPAASYGTMSNVLIGGHDAKRNTPFAYYETIGGGHGAGPSWDGASAMQAHMTNTRNTPIEMLELSCPVRVTGMEIRRGSGGRGGRTGGAGMIRSIELLSAASVTVMSDRRVKSPYGLAGGAPGSIGVNKIRVGGVTKRMPGKFQVDLVRGAVLTVATPGGGGHGRASRPRRRR